MRILFGVNSEADGLRAIIAHRKETDDRQVYAASRILERIERYEFISEVETFGSICIDISTRSGWFHIDITTGGKMMYYNDGINRMGVWTKLTQGIGIYTMLELLPKDTILAAPTYI